MTFEDGPPRRLGIRVGKIRGIEVWLHWMLLLVLVVELFSALLARPPIPFAVQHWLSSSVALLLAVFLHELGHCFAAFKLGGGAERIVLWPLGGLAYCDAPHEPRAQFLTAAGGPIANVIFGALTGIVSACAGWNLLPEVADFPAFPHVQAFCQYFFLWNMFPLIINLMPCYPLDGGRMVQAWLWGRIESFGQATYITLKVSQAFAILGFVCGLLIGSIGFFDPDFKIAHPLISRLSFGLILMALAHLYESKGLLHRLQSGEEEEGGIFGYDFSRGYTSLERTAIRKDRRSLLGSLRERFRDKARNQREQRESEIRERVDALLVKIHEEGMNSLSRSEQRFLKKASRLMKK